MNAAMKAFVALATSFLITAGLGAGVSYPSGDQAWQSRLKEILPILGHRNWILIVDSAYPLETSAGVETLETNSDQIEVVHTVLSSLDQSIHVRPDIYMDAELPFVKEQDAPGVTAYRKGLKALLGDRPIQSLPHEEILKKVDEIGKTYHVLVLKTRMTVPYTSVFLQLDCKYWTSDAEEQLRQAMNRSAQR